MNIKYSKKKEELRRDPVLETIEKARRFIISQSNKLTTGLVVIVLLLAGFQISSYLQRKKLAEVQDDFGRAMLLYSAQDETNAIDAFTRVVEDYGNTPHAAYSAYMVGHMYLYQAKYDNAIDYFQRFVEN